MPKGGTLTIETANVLLDKNFVTTKKRAHFNEYLMIPGRFAGSKRPA
jgi:hypothetical protein